MTIQNIIDWFNNHSSLIIVYFLIIFVISLVGLVIINKNNFQKPITYFYCILIYSTTIPGLLSLVLTLYSFFILKTDLLQFNISTYFIPIISMVSILFIIKKTIPLSEIPGFSKLFGLMILILITFIITFIVQRMFFGVLFVGKFYYLILLFFVFLFAIKIAWNKIKR